MTTAGLSDWAVGFGVRGIGADQTFHYGGASAGFRTWATMFTPRGNGVSVMTRSRSSGAPGSVIWPGRIRSLEGPDPGTRRISCSQCLVLPDFPRIVGGLIQDDQAVEGFGNA